MVLQDNEVGSIRKGRRCICRKRKRKDGEDSSQNGGSEWHKDACCGEGRRPSGVVLTRLPRTLVLMAPPDSASQFPRLPCRCP